MQQKKKPTIQHLMLFIILSWGQLSFATPGTTALGITKPTHAEIINYSGDKQTCSPNSTCPIPIRALILDSLNRPAQGVPVYFNLVYTPGNEKQAKLSQTSAFSDSTGMAKTQLITGSTAGTYLVNAAIDDRSGSSQKQVTYTLTVWEKNWVFVLFMGLVGGLGLFLLGMYLMGQGMQKSAGDKMRAILGRMAHNRFVATGVGAFITMIIQSSSATVVMLMSFVNSKLMRFEQTTGFILGACIGTTITAQIIAFNISDYALLIIAIGFGIRAMAKNHGLQYLGEGVLGFGILFFGMSIMSEAMSPLRSYEPFLTILTQ